MTLVKRHWLNISLLIGLLTFAGQVGATVIYSTDFESGIGSEWSSSTLTTSWDNSPLSTYQGNFSGTSSTTLTLTGLSAHSQILLDFDLYLFQTWDGDSTFCCGPDYFSLAGDVSFSETFTNHQTQSYAGMADECYFGSTVAGCAPASGLHLRTDVYRDLGPTGADSGFLVTHTASTFSVTFAGPTTQSDEWWGIDNVSVSIISASVPEPASIVLLGLGLFGLRFNRRRKF